MASIIIFGTLVGVCLSEWRGASRQTHRLMRVGLVVLVASTVVIGYGNYLAKLSTTAAGSGNSAAAQEQASRAVPGDATK